MGYRTNAANTDLSAVLEDSIEADVKEAADISMGTEVRLFSSLITPLVHMDHADFRGGLDQHQVPVRAGH